MIHRRIVRRPLHLELLESRLVLSAFPEGDVYPVLVAGDPNGSPTDSPSSRVDPNTTTSPFAGVGSLAISTRRGLFICTATPISSRHVLTAGHCVDINGDGRVTSRDGIRSVTFYLNFGGNLTHGIGATVLTTHPDFTGFARPSVNDDLAVLTLGSALPAGVPIYPLYTGSLSGQALTMVGYGQSGDAVNGYYVGASFSVKRHGENTADAFWGQDDAGRPAANEVFRYDFDGPTGNGTFGGPTLGNDRETTLGGGDSGGPSFVQVGGTYQVAGVNTFTQGAAPNFGSLGGGMAVPAYASWIQSIIGGGAPSGGAASGAKLTGAGALTAATADLATDDSAALFASLSVARTLTGLPAFIPAATVPTDRPDQPVSAADTYFREMMTAHAGVQEETRGAATGEQTLDGATGSMVAESYWLFFDPMQ